MATLPVPSSGSLLCRGIAASLYNGTIGIRQLHAPPSFKSFYTQWRQRRVNLSTLCDIASFNGQDHALDSTIRRTVNQRTICRHRVSTPRALKSPETEIGAYEDTGSAPPLMQSEVRRSCPCPCPRSEITRHFFPFFFRNYKASFPHPLCLPGARKRSALSHHPAS